MIDHPEQRKIDPELCERKYIRFLQSQMQSLRLEFIIYQERKDKESCIEIALEYKNVRLELTNFLKARKKMETYHNSMK